MIEKVKRLDNEVQLPKLTDSEEFQHTQVKLHLSGARERVPAKTEGTRRQRKCYRVLIPFLLLDIASTVDRVLF